MALLRETMEPAVLFRLGSDWYGVAVAHVREVVRVPAVTTVPFAPAHVRGIVAVRGEFVPVIDLPRALQLASPTSAQAPIRLVVVAADGLDAAFLVDEVTDVVRIALEGTAALSSWHEHRVHMLDIPTLLDTTRCPRAATMEECV